MTQNEFWDGPFHRELHDSQLLCFKFILCHTAQWPMIFTCLYQHLNPYGFNRRIGFNCCS